MTLPDLDISLMRTFIAIVETGSITAAGKLVGRSQPAITHQIKRLEERLQRPLFESHRRRLVLTSEGQILLEFARAIVRLNNDAYTSLTRGQIAHPVKLGTPDLYAAYLLPDVLRNFSISHPEVEVDLRCTRSVHLSKALQRGELDIAVMTNQPEFERGEVIREEPLIWVAGRNAEPETQNPLPLALLPEGSVYRQYALDALSAAGRSWSIRSVCDSIAGLNAAVASGLAVSIFPNCAVDRSVRRLGRREELPPLPPVQLVMHRRPGGVSDAAEHLAQFIARELASVSPPAQSAD
ncbi:LysR substrate-binding domain-containing protein [Roseiterribacter gracilis]|uniref:LysR family transcriptional regulator n=1 Tax=Roseiterribacter gracilis TaxID=2812848 RepID=A0A8S8X8S4_9PROT|nr:LysR family transcriptional regulator [Rhodospirillales bacterium TMPK1]